MSGEHSGARKIDILHYFQLENLAIACGGAAIGILLALMLSFWLMRNFGMDRIPVPWVLLGVAAVLLLGQFACVRSGAEGIQCSAGGGYANHIARCTHRAAPSLHLGDTAVPSERYLTSPPDWIDTQQRHSVAGDQRYRALPEGRVTCRQRSRAMAPRLKRSPRRSQLSAAFASAFPVEETDDDRTVGHVTHQDIHLHLVFQAPGRVAERGPGRLRSLLD